MLPKIQKYLGPPLEGEKESEKYLVKYGDSDVVVSGPYIEDGRWIAELPRKTTDAQLMLKEKLADGGRKCRRRRFNREGHAEKPKSSR